MHSESLESPYKIECKNMVENHSHYQQYNKAKALNVINITIINIILLSLNILQEI